MLRISITRSATRLRISRLQRTVRASKGAHIRVTRMVAWRRRYRMIGSRDSVTGREWHAGNTSDKNQQGNGKDQAQLE